MRWLKKCAVLLSLVSVVFVVQAKEVDTTNPYKMLNALAEQTFSRLKAEQKKIQADPNYLKVIINEDMMQYVDYQYAALKLLGKNLRGADKKEVSNFIKEFRDYLIFAYAQVLTQYTDQKIQFSQEKEIPDDRRIISIPVQIIGDDRPPINLDFVLIKNKRTNEWKAYDIVVEGISLLSSKQSEWETKIRQQGIPAITKELKEQAEKDIVFERKGE